MGGRFGDSIRRLRLAVQVRSESGDKSGRQISGRKDANFCSLELSRCEREGGDLEASRNTLQSSTPCCGTEIEHASSPAEDISSPAEDAFNYRKLWDNIPYAAGSAFKAKKTETTRTIRNERSLLAQKNKQRATSRNKLCVWF